MRLSGSLDARGRNRSRHRERNSLTTPVKLIRDNLQADGTLWERMWNTATDDEQQWS